MPPCDVQYCSQHFWFEAQQTACCKLYIHSVFILFVCKTHSWPRSYSNILFLTCWLNTVRSTPLQEHFSHPLHTLSVLRSDKCCQKHTGHSDGKAQERGIVREEDNFLDLDLIFFLGSITIQLQKHKQNILNQQRPDADLCN